MESKNIPKTRQEDIVVQELEKELLIYDFRIDKAFCLNETSALIWQACDGTKSVSEISREVGEKVNSPVSENLVWLALDQLSENDLLNDSQPVVSTFEGLSRREIIKKVGLTSMVALPLISSLIAPTAAMGQSVVCGQACTCTMSSGNGQSCGTTGTGCGTGCQCIRANQGNQAGTCGPVASPKTTRKSADSTKKTSGR